MKRVFTLLLAALLCFCAMTACNNNAPVPTPATTAGDPFAPPPAQQSLAIVSGDCSAYQIVVPQNAKKYETDAANSLRFAIKTITGVDIPVVEDTAPAKDTEIVIGKTPRTSGLTQNYAEGYAVLTAGQRVIIEAGKTKSMNQALAQFSMDCFGIDITSDAIYDATDRNDLTVQIGYQIMEKRFDFLADAETVYIYHDNVYLQKRMASLLHETLTADMKDDPNALTVTVTDVFPGLQKHTLMLIDDERLESGTWSISLTGMTASIAAADYYGFIGAIRYLSETRAEMGFYNVLPNQSIFGSYLSTLGELEGGTAYAYNKTAEYRVMFNNVLWDNPVAAERNLLNAEVIAQYMPDVLGCQEFNNSKRHNAGDNDLTKLLAELGYVETIDPRVKNVGKWGSGGEKVTVDGETFYTYYNCAPLFYNKNTTRCIASEYYWYENQKDAENQNNCSAMDCASKAMTWGVFESIATGERYIVVSTHMCTRSDGVRGLQAREAVAVVNRLIAEYDCPVFFGGDLNGRTYHANHIYFVSEEGGFTNVERSDLASLFTSKNVRAHHAPYPVVNSQYGLVWPDATDDTGSIGAENNVDHILIHNHKKDTVDITVFGTVVDHCTKSASDHFPIFIDFSIH